MCMTFLFWIFCLNCSLKEKKKPELGVAVSVLGRREQGDQIILRYAVSVSYTGQPGLHETVSTLHTPPENCGRVSIIVIKHQDKSSPGGKGLLRLRAGSASPEEVRAGTWGTYLEAGTEAEDHEVMLPTGFVPQSASYTTRTTCPGVEPPTVSWIHPYPLSIKKLLHRFAHRPFWWGHCLHGASLFKNDSILRQVDIKLASLVPGPAWAEASGTCMRQERQNTIQ